MQRNRPFLWGQNFQEIKEEPEETSSRGGATKQIGRAHV